MERLFLRRSLPARSTRKSLPTFTFWPSARLCGAALGRFMMVSITIAWLRLECAFSAVNANTLGDKISYYSPTALDVTFWFPDVDLLNLT